MTIEREEGKERRGDQEKEESLKRTMLNMVSALCTFSTPSSSLYLKS
jgi:hypothetical protein